MSTSVNIWCAPGEVPEVKDGCLVVDDMTSISFPINAADRSLWCRTLAFRLLGEAVRADVDAETAQVHLAQARECLAQIRREVGQIADDGWCWKCKVDDHSDHADYDADICAGCACTRTQKSPASQPEG